ncbi:hypothetical protein RXV86_16720 [Alisedimentitalea sp. MJ-SS2]|uniref:hypothetical protein n=1 Tax=Aliisedimentitalea sp. MJ-SS2 TaxID=3049795 RepID=UPI002913C39C|nr:hypothetical protein [Alisedimentitalea sp. MJ-SS2]MDU8929039.1 hypothetical protein [Alisedimentitalea sp. MJ-SS2]
MRRLFDGFQSLIAAVITAGVGFVPAWYAHQAIAADLGPVWVYASVAALIVVSGIMVLAFLRKAGQGIGPLRERRRRG